MEETYFTTIVWRHKLLVLACVVAGLVAAVLATLASNKVYEARATLQAGLLGNTSSADADQALAKSYAEVLTSGSFLQRIHLKLHGTPSVGYLEDHLTAEAIPDTAVIRLKLRASSPSKAIAMAAGVAGSFITSLREDTDERVQRRQHEIDTVVSQLTNRIDHPAPGTSPGRIDQLRASRQALVQQGAALVAEGFGEAVSARRVGPPSSSGHPVSPRPKLNLLAGLLLGLLLGAGLAWLRERRARPLRSAEDAAALGEAPVLASIPLRRRPAADDPALAEAYDILHANLMFQSHQGALHVVTITSENARVGKSSTVEGLGRAADRAGAQVVVVDADLRLAELSSRMGYRGGPSLGDVLAGVSSVDSALVDVSAGLSLLPAREGTPDPPSLLNSPRMRDMLISLRESFDLVLIDSPPVGHLADGLLLSSLSDGVLMVVRPGTTSRPDLVRGIKRLRQTQTPITGLVVFTSVDLDRSYYPARTVAPERTEGRTVAR